MGSFKMRVNHLHCAFALNNLPRGVASKSNMPNPLYLRKHFGNLGRYQTSIKPLVKVNAIATIDNFLNLFKTIIRGEYVIVHQYKSVAPFDGNFFDIHVWSYNTLLSRHNTPCAFIRASASKKTVCGFVIYKVWINGVIGLRSVNRIGKTRVDIIACATTYGFTFPFIITVWSEIKNF